MKTNNLLFLSLAASVLALSASCQSPTERPTVKIGDVLNAIEKRPAFKLRLVYDKDRDFVKDVPESPYVQAGAIYFFKGDAFGVTLGDEKAPMVVYEANPERADLWFQFDQIDIEGAATMVLTIKNNTDHVVLADGLMTNPLQEGAVATDIAPIAARRTSQERWPDPILQLILHNIRFQ